MADMQGAPHTGSEWRFDKTLNFGHVLSAAAFSGALLTGYATLGAKVESVQTQMGSRFEYVERQMGAVERQMGTVTQLLERSTRNDALMETVRAELAENRRRIERLEHGGRGE